MEQTEQVVKEYNKEHHIDNSILVNGRRQTNLGVFRAYLTNYLKSLPDVNKNLTCMVRYLQPTEQGIPVELYFFSAVKEWVPYEGIQADVFDHLLAIVRNLVCAYSRILREKIFGSGIEEIKKVCYICG